MDAAGMIDDELIGVKEKLPTFEWPGNGALKNQ